MDVVTNAFWKIVPRFASRSRFGVCTTRLPMKPTASHRRSSARMNRMLGRDGAAEAPSSKLQTTKKHQAPSNKVHMFFLPLFPTQEGGEGRGEEEISQDR